MSAQRRNMLEAFRSVEPKPTPPAAPPTPPPPPKPPVDRGGGDPSPGASPSFVGEVPVSKLLWGVGVVAAFALGVLVGRAGAPPTDDGAGGDDEVFAAVPERYADDFVQPPPRTESSTRRPTTPDANTTADTSKAARSAAPLLDAKNQYTVQVATYGGTQEELALATYDFLVASGVPAFVPYRVGDKLVVLAGAAPTKAELSDLRRRINGLVYGGDEAFSDAYVTSIDSLVER